MYDIDLNEQFIVYAIFKGNGRWYISDKEIWYLDYNKWDEAYRKAGYEIKEEWTDERRKDLLCLDENNIPLFMSRIKTDECSTFLLKSIYFQKGEDVEYKPSLYVDFDNKIFYSMYIETVSYEDYVPKGWRAEYKSFLDMIPCEKRYWVK